MQTFGVTNKEHYGMLRYFLEWSIAFSNRWVFDENARRINVDGRPKRIVMYAFSNENELEWTGPRFVWIRIIIKIMMMMMIMITITIIKFQARDCAGFASRIYTFYFLCIKYQASIYFVMFLSMNYERQLIFSCWRKLSTLLYFTIFLLLSFI